MALWLQQTEKQAQWDFKQEAMKRAMALEMDSGLSPDELAVLLEVLENEDCAKTYLTIDVDRV